MTEVVKKRKLQPEIVKKPKQVFDGGFEYEGDWRGKLREGFGVQTWPDCKIYEGKWIQDKRHD